MHGHLPRTADFSRRCATSGNAPWQVWSAQNATGRNHEPSLAMPDCETRVTAAGWRPRRATSKRAGHGLRRGHFGSSPSKTSPALPEADLEHILRQTEGLWRELRGQRLFITGGTGFIGRWLLASFCQANDKLDLGASATVLTPKPGGIPGGVADTGNTSFRSPAKRQCGGIRFSGGRILTPDTRGHGKGFHHQATGGGAAFRSQFERDTASAGTGTTLRGKAADVYQLGSHLRQPTPTMRCIPEDFTGDPLPTDAGTAYAQSKRASEFLCAALAQKGSVAVTISRPFALVGPGLSLNANFAIGNFIRDALLKKPISIQGDGIPLPLLFVCGGCCGLALDHPPAGEVGTGLQRWFGGRLLEFESWRNGLPAKLRQA